MFSTGVIMYVMLTGRSVFKTAGNDVQMLIRMNEKCDIEFPHKLWESITVEAKDLCEKMLEKEPKNRITAQAAMDHPWFKMDFDNLGQALTMKVGKLDLNAELKNGENPLESRTPVMAGRILNN
jgi:serine/threonine protein kinase